MIIKSKTIARLDHWIPFFFEVRPDRKIDFWSWGKGNEFYLREPGNGVAGEARGASVPEIELIFPPAQKSYI